MLKLRRYRSEYCLLQPCCRSVDGCSPYGWINVREWLREVGKLEIDERTERTDFESADKGRWRTEHFVVRGNVFLPGDGMAQQIVWL